MLRINLSAIKEASMVRVHSRHMLRMVKIRLARPENKLLLDYFKKTRLIKEVFVAKSDDLLALNDKIWRVLKARHADQDIHDALKRSFSHARFFKKETPRYNAFHLCAGHALMTCAYCNVNSIPTIITRKPKKLVARPPLDHFFAAKLYPLLAISFYNLVPSCDRCNSIFKRDEPTHPKTHLNPHVGEFGDDFIFRFAGYKKIDDILAPGAVAFKIKLQNKIGDGRFDGNEKLFHLEDIYSAHHTAARNCLIKAMNFNSTTLNNIAIQAGITGSDPYQLLFDSRLELENLHLHPLSKLKRDVVKKYASIDLKSKLGI